MTAPTIETLGPVDPSAGTRAKLYAGLALITPLLGALATFNIITTDQGNAIIGFITGTMGLLGLFGFGLAASKTNTQVKNGTFAEAPINPVGNVFENLGTIKQQVDATVDYAQTAAVQAVTTIQGAAAMIPGGALITGAVMSGPVGDLIQSMTDLGDDRSH